MEGGTSCYSSPGSSHEFLCIPCKSSHRRLSGRTPCILCSCEWQHLNCNTCPDVSLTGSVLFFHILYLRMGRGHGIHLEFPMVETFFMMLTNLQEYRACSLVKQYLAVTGHVLHPGNSGYQHQFSSLGVQVKRSLPFPVVISLHAHSFIPSFTHAFINSVIHLKTLVWSISFKTGRRSVLIELSSLEGRDRQ